MNRTGYVIAPQDGISITSDDYGDVVLVQNGVSITIRAANVATMAEILIDIDNGRHASDDDPIDVDSPEDDEPPPVNTNADVNTADVNTDVNNSPDRKVYMREYMRKRRHRNGGDSPRHD